MYIFVTSHDTKKYDSGSCRDLVYYYEKENDIAETGEKEMFFNSRRTDIQAHEVIDGIDDNCKGKGLKTKDAKFYNVFINPSQDELRHILNDKDKLKDYACDVMKEYAESFNRVGKDGQKVSIDDFVWYGKLESQRYFKSDNKIVKHNEVYAKISKDLKTEKDIEKRIILRGKLDDMGGLYVIQGDKTIVRRKGDTLHSDTVIKRNMPRPEECQNHVHIIVSRCHRTKRLSYSPMANPRRGFNTLNGRSEQIGFDREEFAKKGEILFDLKFDYKRTFEKSYQYREKKETKQIAIDPARKKARIYDFEAMNYNYQNAGQLRAIAKNSGYREQFHYKNRSLTFSKDDKKYRFSLDEIKSGATPDNQRIDLLTQSHERICQFFDKAQAKNDFSEYARYLQDHHRVSIIKWENFKKGMADVSKNQSVDGFTIIDHENKVSYTGSALYKYAYENKNMLDGRGTKFVKRSFSPAKNPESLDYYTVLVNGKLLDMQAKSLHTGINQLSVLIYRSPEDSKGIVETLDRFAERFHPGFVQQRLNQQYEAIRNLKFLDHFTVGNLPAHLLKKGVEAAVKPLTKSFMI